MSILQKIYDGKYSTGHVLTKMPFTLRLKQRAFFDAVEEAMGAEFVQRPCVCLWAAASVPPLCSKHFHVLVNPLGFTLSNANNLSKSPKNQIEYLGQNTLR